MILFLGLLDVIAGLLGLTVTTINLYSEIALYAFIALMLKGLWSVYTGKDYFLILLLGLLDLITGFFGVISSAYGSLYTATYLLSLIIILKGSWSVFTTLFKGKA